MEPVHRAYYDRCMIKKTLLGLFCVLAASGCGVETLIFPVFETPSLLSVPPAPLGPFAVNQRRVEFADLGDGQPGGVTVFEPVGVTGPRPTLVWVLGVNNRPHFHQSFHEFLASWGFVDLVPDTRDISFLDGQYHRRNTDNALRTFERARAGDLGVAVDSDRMAWGGYSVGGTMAAFAAADSAARALLLWAPAPSPFWQGLSPDALLPGVDEPSLFILGELDNVVGDWPQQMQARMAGSVQTVDVISQGVHLFFQQPTAVDDRNPPTTITRPEQLRQAFELSRAYLFDKLAVASPNP